MTREELVIGRVYKVKHVTGYLQARLDNIREVVPYRGHFSLRSRRTTYRYECTNLTTGRSIRFKSAGHFINEV